MSDSVQIALITAVIILVVFIVTVIVFRKRITLIEAGKDGIKITLSDSDKELAAQNLVNAEKSKNQEASSPVNVAATKEKISNLKSKIPKSVLWVDDHPSNNAYEVQALEPLGIKVVQAKSNAEGYVEIENHRPDLVITDIARDNQTTDGVDLIKTLSEQRPGLPIIVYTGVGFAKRKKSDFLSQGADAVTAYPSELIQLVIDYLK